MPGCKCGRCPGYKSKNPVQAVLTKLGGGALTGCANAIIHIIIIENSYYFNKLFFKKKFD